MKLFASFAKTNTAVHPNSGLGFGCMGITSFYGDALSDKDAMALLQTVYDSGVRHFDTAEAYVNPDPEKHNEKVLGKFLNTVPRDSYSIATKYWPGQDAVHDYETVKAHLTQSLERLGLSHVDLYYSHRVTSLEAGIAFAKAATKLKEEGLIKAVGLSEVNGAWLKQIHTQGGPIDAVQQEWSILTRTLEEELVPVCKELDVCVVAYSPLSRNLLVQKLEAAPADWRKDLPRYQAMEQNKKLADQVHDLAHKSNSTPAQLCLAWLFQKATEFGVSVVPIPGTTKPERATGNAKATDVKISADDMKVLDAMASQVVGARYQEGFMGNGMTIESQTTK
uniref:NADP-dependent oxidoreductase domain-containing protein n=1 Tax=Pseudictyota dubia TaxID=2749911 RepID=A0A7R9W3I1_9STRA|mmetsp:Transcript_32071/g.59074  ORF Transcript_32071/g.59074 Transcript_32071/m.59074 type:complete len:336 (+) Transcript_32071:54-1061(+)|eukprot:CAMPEP_0197446350 /NCGR_PEP_ID=MMETSP1175-20131217/11315_1 /TAXON_ID=1003142 /ORGANISM="Triceratium dubium, Strain CCMP147" /LENGTH=335 /DNA_ID=CAMNT_0042977447 /DNA_START=154 /DNA_END=1161 /DNA_ORIENTATION=-